MKTTLVFKSFFTQSHNHFFNCFDASLTGAVLQALSQRLYLNEESPVINIPFDELRTNNTCGIKHNCMDTGG